MDRKSQRREHRGARVSPGTVALLCAGHARYTQVLQCFMALDLPPGTRTHIYGGGVDVPHNRNKIVSTFQGDWLLMIDDDQLFTPDLAMRLLRRLDQPRVDVVVPLILRRSPPHEPVLELLPTGATELVRVKLTDQSGLLPVYAAGTGIVLIRRRVFERIGEPWFERHPRLSDDYYFCVRAQEAGCGVFCDLDVRVGHVAPMAVWPTRLPNGRWAAAYTTMTIGGVDAVQTEVARMEKATRRSRQGVSAHKG